MIGAAIVFGVLWLTLLTGMIELRRRDQRRLDADRRVVRLHFPPDVTVQDVGAFTRSLVMLGTAHRHILRGMPSVVFEAAATSARIEHRLHLPVHRADELVQQLRAANPGIEVEPVESLGPPPPAKAVSELRLSSGDRSLRTDQPESGAAALLAALTALRHGERVVVAYTVTAPRKGGPAPTSSPKPTQTTGLAKVLSALLDQSTPTVATPKEWRDKHAEPVFPVAVRIGAEAATPARAGALVRRQVAVLHSVERPGVGFVRLRLPRRVVADRLRRGASPAFGTVTQLNAKELAVVIAWPVGNPRVPGLVTQRARRLAPTPQIHTTGVVFGDSAVTVDRRPIAISPADSLLHAVITGPTGSGKSTLEGNLALQHIAAGRALVLVDPKRDLAEAVLDRIPPDRTQDVIWFDLSDTERPVGLNVLEGAHRAPERVADQVLNIFTRRYGAQLGPRSRDLVHAALLTVARIPGMTLVEVPALLTDAAFRASVLAQGQTDRVLTQFWAAFEAFSAPERAAITAPILNKLRVFTLDPRIRSCIGQAEPTWTMEEVLDQRKILLVALDRGELGAEAASVVGSLVVTRLWEAVQRRAIRLPAAVILDEFQDFLSTDTDLGDVLAKARSYGIGVCLAHQHAGQLGNALRMAVAANARTKVAFQAGFDDATALARQFGGDLTPADFMGLEAYHAYVAACVGGEVMPPASLVTRPLPPALGTAQLVRSTSRQLYGRNRSEVEAAMARRQDGRGPESPLGRRRRSS